MKEMYFQLQIKRSIISNIVIMYSTPKLFVPNDKTMDS